MSFMHPNDPQNLQTLQAQWREAWPHALALWSRFTQLKEPKFCLSRDDERREGLTGSFAMIRLDDHAVVVSLPQIAANGLHEYSTAILAHEIGHHILCPSNLSDHARCLARMRYALPTKEHHAPMVANLYTDLLINDRLRQGHNLPMEEIYRSLEREKTSSESELWTFYLRVYEVLWNLPKGDLARGSAKGEACSEAWNGAWSDTLEADAVLGARVVRSYAKDWLRGSGRFAALCLTYLMNDEEKQENIKIWLDASGAISGDMVPDGLSEMDDDEIEGARHPAFDENLSGIKKDVVPQQNETEPEDVGRAGTGGSANKSSTRSYREIGDYIDILRLAGVKLSDHEIAIRYYRERALPHLIRFPSRAQPMSLEPTPEGTESWEIGEALESLDLLESVVQSPQIVPGYTTRQRVYGDSPGNEKSRRADDLYLGIDCSGSMPNPQQFVSYPVLSGVVMALSALRAGASVMAVLSGDPGPHVSTEEWTRDEHRVLEVLTGYLGTGYAFGVHHMAQTFETRREESGRAHIVLVTDADLFSMMERGAEGKPQGFNWKRTRAVLPRTASATAALNMEEAHHKENVARLRDDGWRVHSVRDWGELVAFAQTWSRENYEK